MCENVHTTQESITNLVSQLCDLIRDLKRIVAKQSNWELSICAEHSGKINRPIRDISKKKQSKYPFFS